MADIFKDIIPAILKTKEEVVTKDNEKDYVPFVVNKALSFHYDCILRANEMNMLPNTPRLMQFHYYLNSVRAWNRPFRKWEKLIPQENLSYVMEYYSCSPTKAKEILSLLSEKDLNTIKERLYKGGLNDKSQRTNRGEAS